MKLMNALSYKQLLSQHDTEVVAFDYIINGIIERTNGNMGFISITSYIYSLWKIIQFFSF